MAIAVINSSNSSYTVTDLVAGSTTRFTYPLAGTSAYYVQSPSGEKSLSLFYQSNTVIVMSNTVTGFGYGNSIFGSTDPDTALVSVQSNLGSGGNSGSATPMPKIGDIKQTYYNSDHDGWVKMVGQPKSSLTATQQVNATALGFGTSLVNGADLVLIGASATKLVGSTGGAATATITQANLPNVNLTATAISAGTPAGSIDAQGAHTHPVTVNFHDTTGDGFNGGRIQSTDRNPLRTQANASEVQVQSAGSHSHNFTGSSLPNHSHVVPLGGSGVAVPIQNPYLAANVFIYLGV